MARFAGKVGYAEQQETVPGVWEDVITEKQYRGDVLRNTASHKETPDSTNDELRVSNSISIVADAYALNHFFAIKYLRWQGACWKVDSVEVQAPRLILRIGGVYHGITAPVAPTP